MSTFEILLELFLWTLPKGKWFFFSTDVQTTWRNLLVISLEGNVADGNVVVSAGGTPHPVVGEGLSRERLEGEATLHCDIVSFPRVMLLVVTSHCTPHWNKTHSNMNTVIITITIYIKYVDRLGYHTQSQSHDIRLNLKKPEYTVLRGMKVNIYLISLIFFGYFSTTIMLGTVSNKNRLTEKTFDRSPWRDVLILPFGSISWYNQQ